MWLSSSVQSNKTDLDAAEKILFANARFQIHGKTSFSQSVGATAVDRVADEHTLVPKSHFQVDTEYEYNNTQYTWANKRWLPVLLTSLFGNILLPK